MADKQITLSRLIKELQKLERKGMGRRYVSVAKDTLWDGNGTFTVCAIHDAVPIWLTKADGDGFTEYRQDGTEKGATGIILRGQWSDECPTREEQEARRKRSAQ